MESRNTPSRIVGTLDLKTSTTAESVVEQSSAQRCSVHTVSLTVQVPVPTRTAFQNPTRQKQKQRTNTLETLWKKMKLGNIIYGLNMK